MIKSSEKELVRKKVYYLSNRNRILARKKQRSHYIYLNKRKKILEDPSEYEKEQIRYFCRRFYPRSSSCMDCGLKAHNLMLFVDYESCYAVTLCLKCHINRQKLRRRGQKRKICI
jgi:hypothetical protein